MQNLTEMRLYMFQGDASCPFVIYGTMGIGKTSLLTKVAHYYHNLLFIDPSEEEQEENASPIPDFVPVIVMRLMGNPDQTYPMQDLLTELTQQICVAYGQEAPPPSTDVSETIDTFHDCMNFATKGNPLFILLDAVDNLSVPIMLDDLEWLPESLPEDVKLIITVTQAAEENTDRDILADLQDKISDPECFLELGTLPDMDAFKAIQQRLYTEDRGLSEKQAISVALLVQKCTHPMYLQFLGNAVVRWPSFYIFDAEYPPMADCLDEMILQVKLVYNMLHHIYMFISKDTFYNH